MTGPIEVRLLPTPYLQTGPGTISARAEARPSLSFELARLELALVKLASGAIRFSEIELDKPVLTISRAADGTLRLPVFPAAEAETVGFDRLAVRDGKVRIAARAAGGAERQLNGVQLELDAASLAGPYHLSGQFSGPAGTPVVFRLDSEKSGPEGTPIRASVDAGSNWPAIQFDGALDPSGPNARSPRVTGSATIVGAGSAGGLDWRAVGRMTADLDRAAIEHAEFRVGPEERALHAEGSATLTYGARFGWSSRRKRNRQTSTRSCAARARTPCRRRARWGCLRIRFGRLSGGAGLIAVDARLAASDVILGGETLSDVSGSARSRPGAPLNMSFDLGLPGHSRLKGMGELQTGAAARFDGTIDFRADDPALLGRWSSPGAPEFADRVAAFANRSASVAGRIEASATGFSGHDLTIGLDRSKLTGSIAFARPAGAEPGRLDMDLSSDSLDVDALPGGSASAALIGGLDLSLSLKAKALHVNRLNDTEIDSGSLALKVVKSGPDISLDRLNVTDLGGADLDAEGAVGRDGLSLTGRLRADRLRDFAALVSRLAPGDWSRTLAERADALSPATLAFEAHGNPVAGGAPVLSSLKAKATLGQTQAAIGLEPDSGAGRQLLTVNLDLPDTSALLRQLGVKTIGASGRGRIALRASGAWAQGYDFEATGALAGTDLSAQARILPAAEGDDARLFGSVKLKSQNVSPLLATLGLAPAGGAIGPVEASADLTLRGDRWTASRAAATVAGVKATGDLAYEPAAKLEDAAPASLEPPGTEAAIAAAEAIASEPQPAEITGELSLDRLPAGELLALALGPLQPVKRGAWWSEAKFAPVPLNPPSAAIRLRIGTLDMIDGLAARGFSTALRFDRGRLDLDDMEMKVAGAAASGHMTLRRDRESATTTGALRVEQLAIDRPPISGRLTGTLEFASTGKSPAALIEGLAGAGTAELAGASLAGSDLGALDRVVAKAQAADAQIDETNVAYALDKELDKAALPIPGGATPIALTAGTMKFGPLPIARPRGAATVSASLDLGKLSLETRLTLTSPATGLKFWSGPPPSATVTVSDALPTRKRQLDVAGLSAGLATQAIARESERIAALDADIRERAYFNRRLKGERFIDRRAAEMQAWRAEQERLKSLAGRAASEKAASERAEAEKKAASEKQANDKAAADEAAAEKAIQLPPLPPELPGGPILRRATAPAEPPARDDQLGANAPPVGAPLPPLRPKLRPAPEPAPLPVPTQGGLY